MLGKKGILQGDLRSAHIHKHPPVIQVPSVVPEPLVDWRRPMGAQLGRVSEAFFAGLHRRRRANLAEELVLFVPAGAKGPCQGCAVLAEGGVLHWQ